MNVDTSLFSSIDERTRLAGTNNLEVLLFKLGESRETGRNELYGINVFKVREVLPVPEITRAPDMPKGVEGLVSLRGDIVPVINLQSVCGIDTDTPPGILMVTEYNSHVQGFLVADVETINRFSWEEVKESPALLSSQTRNLVTAVARLADGRLVQILDVERILAENSTLYDDSVFDSVETMAETKGRKPKILFADDSAVARGQIIRTLDAMGVDYVVAKNGKQAWEMLEGLAANVDAVTNIDAILTDIEMPEMDGYVLTRKIKSHPKLSGIPVLMHSSMTGAANQDRGKNVGADAYISKFEPKMLSDELRGVLS